MATKSTLSATKLTISATKSTATSCRIQVVADLLPKPATKSTVSATKLNVSATVDFVADLLPVSAVDRDEFNLVASVYWVYVLFAVLVDACCHKQHSLMRDVLRDKGASTLSTTNYSTVEVVDDTAPVIDPKAIYWSKVAIFAPIWSPRQNIAITFGVEN